MCRWAGRPADDAAAGPARVSFRTGDDHAVADLLVVDLLVVDLLVVDLLVADLLVAALGDSESFRLPHWVQRIIRVTRHPAAFAATSPACVGRADWCPCTTVRRVTCV